MTSTMQVSSLDAAYAISALLEYPNNINEFNETQARKADDQNDRNLVHQEIENKKQKFKVLENLNSCLHDNFWVAYDALEFKYADTLLYKGIQSAKNV